MAMTKKPIQPAFVELVREEALQQLLEQQRIIRYDTREYTVEVLLQKFRVKDLVIPDYQRDLVWTHKHMSKFLESVLLGLPIPVIFTALLPETGQLEIVDGSQRLRSLYAFMEEGFRLENLERLDLLAGFSFSDLSLAEQRKFKNRTMRTIELDDSTELSIRFDLFERINTGAKKVEPSELRRGAFPGPFYDLVHECASNPVFLQLCGLSSARARRAEAEELVLRFFAYGERYQQFVHGVRDFLDQYIIDMNRDGDIAGLRDRFKVMLEFVDAHFPDGFRKPGHGKAAPRVRFEAISVGTHLALASGQALVTDDMAWLGSPEFKDVTTTDGSNSKPRLAARIEFVRDKLLGGH